METAREVPTQRDEDVLNKWGEERGDGGGIGEVGERERMRQTAVMLLVILSGSLETRALLRQLSEDKARNRRMDFSLQPPQLVMLLCQEQSSAFTSPCVLFFHFACLSRLKAEAETKVPSSSPFLIPAVWSLFERKKAAFRV